MKNRLIEISAFKFMRFTYFETYASNPSQICILEATKPVARTFAIYLAWGQNDV